MARKKKNNAGCIAAGIIVIVLFSIVAGAVWFIKTEYKSKQDKISLELSELPVFDKEEVGKEIANVNGYQYPVSSPSMTPSEISSKSQKDAETLSRKNYPASSFARKQAEIFKKYRQAKKGEEVLFFLNTTRKNIKGIYKGTFSDHKGRFIKVDFNEYRLPDILEDFHFLFIDGIAEKKATDKRKELETQFKTDKNNFFQEQKKLITEKLYKDSGYTKLDGIWIPNLEIFTSKLEDKEMSFGKKLKKERNKIYELNKLLSFIKVEVPTEEESKKADPEESE